MNSRRDLFAAAALQGILAYGTSASVEVAALAFDLADAMLEEARRRYPVTKPEPTTAPTGGCSR